MPRTWMVRTAAGLLGAYAIAIVVGLMSPSNDPQRGMAYGLLMMMLMLLGVIGAALWFGAHTGRNWIVWSVFILCVYPAVMLVARWIYVTVTRMRG